MTFRVDWHASGSTPGCRMGVRQGFNLHCKGSNISTDLGVRCALLWTSHSTMRNGESKQCTPFQASWIVKWARCLIRIKSECPVPARLFPWRFFCAFTFCTLSLMKFPPVASVLNASMLFPCHLWCLGFGYYWSQRQTVFLVFKRICMVFDKEVFFSDVTLIYQYIR